MNHSLFEEHTKMLVNILDKSSLDLKEKKYRKENLLKIYNQMVETNSINSRYYNLSHEIRSLDFLNNYGCLVIASDSKSEKGCDFYLDSGIQIECVCSSRGDEKKNGLDQFNGNGVFDYNVKEGIILSRLTQSINEKVLFYQNHILDKSINPNKPYIIFLGLGNLTYGMINEKFGFTLNKILFGVGHIRLHLNLETNSYVKQDYTYNRIIKKHNNADINCNLFASSDYNCVSAIIYTTANLDERYTTDNTFLFINPTAVNKIRANKFSNMIYWRKNKRGEYIPRSHGKDMNHHFIRKWY